MGLNKKSVDDINAKGKRVLVRCDFNVPLKNGEITEPFIVESTNEQANASVLNAVQTGAPYKPLPAKFPGDGVNTQVQLKYIKN